MGGEIAFPFPLLSPALLKTNLEKVFCSPEKLFQLAQRVLFYQIIHMDPVLAIVEKRQ
jgi:hypothetical protein